MGCKYETQKDPFLFLPIGPPAESPANRRQKNCKTGLRPRIVVAARIVKSRRLHASASLKCHPTDDQVATIVQQPIQRNARFAYIYYTNQLLN